MRSGENLGTNGTMQRASAQSPFVPHLKVHPAKKQRNHDESDDAIFVTGHRVNYQTFI